MLPSAAQMMHGIDVPHNFPELLESAAASMPYLLPNQDAAARWYGFGRRHDSAFERTSQACILSSGRHDMAVV